MQFFFLIHLALLAGMLTEPPTNYRLITLANISSQGTSPEMFVFFHIVSSFPGYYLLTLLHRR